MAISSDGLHTLQNWYLYYTCKKGAMGGACHHGLNWGRANIPAIQCWIPKKIGGMTNYAHARE